MPQQNLSHYASQPWQDRLYHADRHGNYNEKTNAMYTDLCLMTADQTIGEDAAAFFCNMLVNKLDGEYKKLCVSPFGIKDIIANYLITNLIKVCLLRRLTPYRM